MLRRRAFLSIGAVGGEGGGGRHWREQTEACKSGIVPMYPLNAHQFVLGHSLDVVQVEVLQAHQSELRSHCNIFGPTRRTETGHAFDEEDAHRRRALFSSALGSNVKVTFDLLGIIL